MSVILFEQHSCVPQQKGGLKLINTNKIKGRMKELEITQLSAARHLGIAESTFNLKINNNRSLNLNEAKKLSLLLKINLDEFDEYFFTQ